jgi:spore coat polysaccharide biosynthesis protein SpsF
VLPTEREHVTPYLYKHPSLFSLRNVAHVSNLSAYRLTVDYDSGLKVVQQIYRHFRDQSFGFMDVIEFLTKNPEIRRINHNF